MAYVFLRPANLAARRLVLLALLPAVAVFFDFNALVAPVLKMLVYAKLFFIKTVPGWFVLAYTALKKGLANLAIFFGNWEAWSSKKLIRHCIRFMLTFSARIVILTFLINLFFGKERRGIKNLPRLAKHKLSTSWFGGIIRWWETATERQKRILTGIILGVILIAAGQAFVGVSILLFDLVWELLIALSRFTLKAWRFIYPVVLRFIPNAIGAFFTNKLLPFFANAMSIIKDDFRTIYLRTSFRKRYREYRKRLLKYSRTKRSVLRDRIRPFLSASIRDKKTRLINRAADIDEKE